MKNKIKLEKWGYYLKDDSLFDGVSQAFQFLLPPPLFMSSPNTHSHLEGIRQMTKVIKSLAFLIYNSWAKGKAHGP